MFQFEPGGASEPASCKLMWEVQSGTAFADAAFSVDCTIIAEAPRMAPFLPEMRLILSSLLLISPTCINVKATTTDGMGYVGRGEGIAAHAVASISDAHVE